MSPWEGICFAIESEPHYSLKGEIAMNIVGRKCAWSVVATDHGLLGLNPEPDGAGGDINYDDYRTRLPS